MKCSRKLTPKEEALLQNQNTKLVSDFKSKKLEEDARKMWDLFYKRNNTNFFKDRHWTFREFEELNDNLGENKLVLLEAGCGVGNAIFPILKDRDNIFVYACDFSPRAVQYVKENDDYNPEKCCAFQHDLSSQCLADVIAENSVDLVTLLFVMSAIHPEKFTFVLLNLHRVLKPGGHLLFRDYGLHDWAMLRFKPGSKIDENLYVRQDGTRAYYFEKDFMANIVTASGFEIKTNEYVMRETTNKKDGVTVPRVFLQGKYIKKHDKSQKT